MYFTRNTPMEQVISIVKSQASALFSNPAVNGVDIEVKEHKVKRSSEQNSFYWLNLEEISKVLNMAGCTYGEHNIPYTKELVHTINKSVFGVDSTSRLKVQEFCDYMTRMFDFWIDRTRGEFRPKEAPSSYLERTGIIPKAA